MYRKEICQGFAQALVYLYLQVGLDVDLGRGATDTSMHMFVYINLNGEEVFIDPTWESSREGTGLSFFGINTNFYNDNELTVRDSLNFVSNEAYNGNLTSEKYKPLWQMKEILSITREDGNLAIDYIDSEGNEMQFIVPN